MAARCDGDQLGELIFYQLSKQQLMYGPMQIESRIDQDQNISKDLTLWNQQGSHVLRGNIIALPVTGGFLYVESIYIQATEARMPQLKKVVLAMGDRLIYRDTFDEALADLTGAPLPASPAPAVAAATAPAAKGSELPSFAERLRSLQQQAQKLAQEVSRRLKKTRVRSRFRALRFCVLAPPFLRERFWLHPDSALPAGMRCGRHASLLEFSSGRESPAGRPQSSPLPRASIPANVRTSWMSASA